MRSQNEKRKLLTDLISGKISPFDLVEKSREVWRQDTNDKEMYKNNATGQRLHYEELQSRIKRLSNRTDFILVTYGLRHKENQTLNLNENEN